MGCGRMENEHAQAHSDSRERILDEAKVLFALHGYRGLSMRAIAEAVGISKAGIYYHFRDKEDLFTAIVHRYLDDLARLIDASQQAHVSVRTQVEDIVRAILRQPAEDRALVRLAGQEMAHLSEAARRRFDAAYEDQFIGRLRGVIAAGVARGELRALNPETAAWALLGMMYPYFTPAGEKGDPLEPVIADLLRIYFDGLSAADPPHAP